MADPQVAKLDPQSNPGSQTASHWQIPDKGDALKLVPSDYEQAARELGVEAAAIHAVASVESGGRTGFDSHSRPKIRYENHFFRRLTHGKYDHSHPDLSCAYGSRQYKLTHGTHADQYKLLHAAFALAPDAAVMSCSWGMFQVMGENYKSIGWKDLEQFVKDMFHSEGQHLRAFLGFCKHNGLVPYLKNHNWASFARGYNGPSYAENAYDVKMRTYYQQYARQH
jgi:hypothetical protein